MNYDEWLDSPYYASMTEEDVEEEYTEVENMAESYLEAGYDTACDLGEAYSFTSFVRKWAGDKDGIR